MGIKGAPHEYDDKIAGKIEALSYHGFNIKEIASYLEISSNTIQKYYSESFQAMVVDKNERVAQSLFYQAVSKGNVTAQIFWLKCQAKWKEEKDDNYTDLKEIKAAISKLANDLPD